MRLALKVTLPLLLLSGLLTSGGLWMARQRPALTLDTRLSGLEVCDLPCWAGITPGMTDFDDAPSLIQTSLPLMNSPMLISGSQINFTANVASDIDDSVLYAGQLYYQEGRVGDVRLNVNLPLWYLLDALGQPACVWGRIPASMSSALLVIYWEQEGISTGAVVLASQAHGLQPDLTVGALFMNLDTGACYSGETRPWVGFARPWFYKTVE
jgi:hypothetical protein